MTWKERIKTCYYILRYGAVPYHKEYIINRILEKIIYPIKLKYVVNKQDIETYENITHKSYRQQVENKLIDNVIDKIKHNIIIKEYDDFDKVNYYASIEILKNKEL